MPHPPRLSPSSHPWNGLPGPRPDPVAALQRIGSFLHPTPLEEVPDWPGGISGPVRVKPEWRQVTGSFKVRGAASFLTSLSKAERRRGVVACSSGNHGLAVAHVAARMGTPATIVLPEGVDPVKVEGIRKAGARLVALETGYDDAEAHALEMARDEGAVFVSPFDDPAVIEGQGTLALEILEECPEVARVVLPLSGGGLAGGVGLALRDLAPGVEVVAVSAARARVMLDSLEAGRPMERPEEPTLAGALSGGIGRDNRWTFPLVARVVDRHAVVEEVEIARAMRRLHALGMRVEGGGAVGMAALWSGRLPPVGGPTVVILSGGNVSPRLLEELQGPPAGSG